MNSDREKPQVPARREPTDVQIQPPTDVQGIIGYLPPSETIDEEERIILAGAEDYDSLAIDLALKSPAANTAEKLLLLGFVIVAAALVIFFFPLNRFFKPTPKDLGPMSIGGPILEDSLSPSTLNNQPWLKALVEIDQLYYQDGKLTEAIQKAETELEKVPETEWETWQKVYYRYWELLSDAVRVHALKTSTRAYLAKHPEDPFANFYYAQAFLAAADRLRTMDPETKEAYRHEADAIAQQIERTCSSLNAQRKHPEAEDEVTLLTDLYRNLRLKQAKLYVFMWKLGGYKEDDHADVIFRDNALNICDNDELSDMKEVKALKASIYTHILDRWHWFEGPQLIQGSKYRRKYIQQQLDELEKELTGTDTL